jgi:hypothetical protein
MATKKTNTNEVGIAQAARDVLVASLNKGQFLPALLGFLFAIMLVRMSPVDVSRLVFQILADLENGKLLGYALALVFASGWAFHVKWQRRAITAEMRRVSRERNDLQAQATPAQIESSESRRLPAPRKGRQP